MSTREKCNYLLGTLTEEQLVGILSILEEAADDAYCEKLYQEYEASPDKGEYITQEELCRELGISL